MTQGYSSLSNKSDIERAQIQYKQDPWYHRPIEWWKEQWNGDEHKSLINSRTGTFELPRRNTFRTVVTVVSIILGVLSLGVLASLAILNGKTNKRIPTAAETYILTHASANNTHQYLKQYASETHIAGSNNDKKQAEWTRDKFIEFGIDTEIATYWPLLNYPTQHRLAVVSGPKEFHYEASLTEDIVDEDPTSKEQNAVPAFHGYSKNGSATGPVVYANYGRPEDFEYLLKKGIRLNGTIALMRYGGIFRGLKVKAAEDYGCIGALIYSDPIDDGPVGKEDSKSSPAKAYPEGPWRSSSSIQRGSVLYLSLGTGDPLTPDEPATQNATRIKMEDTNVLPSIPSLPLSWKDALPLLKATQGHGVYRKNNWMGGLEGVDYFSGPSEGDVNMVNGVEYKITPIWNVIGRIEGSEEPDSAIILGNHRDSWVYGATDPSSGSATMLELARLFGELLKSGWRPKRTIILASWDGEEYGMVGSTEWAEEHKSWLSKNGAAYINVDLSVTGSHFSASASPSLSRLLYEVTQAVTDPNTGSSVYDAWNALPKPKDIVSNKPYVGQLGSGSDFVPFLDYLGIASVDMSFLGDYGVYHSNYDSIHWLEKFGDPTFKYHETMVKIWGLVALRLADDLIIPIHALDYTAELDRYVSILNKYSYPHVFPYLEKAVGKMAESAHIFHEELNKAEEQLTQYMSVSSEKVPVALKQSINSINKRLINLERGFLDPEGIKGRTWFKHVIYAPGLWTGYSSQVFPAIIDGLDSKNTDLTRHAEERAIKSILHGAKKLKREP
ncbi:hypothetical protein BDF14DRAFT_1751934 [Spinellus fusiger]|nr:hypothetical protein BDF14DRAFT_1751934 [Spinellus fusiger]